MPLSSSPLPTPRHSVVFNTLLAFVVIISFTLLSMLISLYTADALQGDAEAINHAGSLRMQAYRLAITAQQDNPALLQQHIEGLDRTLQSQSLRSALTRHGGPALSERYNVVRQHWQQHMRPLLNNPAPTILRYHEELPHFVEELNHFVLTLQQASEQKLEIIRGLQIATLFISVIIAFVLIYGLHNNLASPLSRLTELTRQVSRGDFSGQVHIAGETELSLLGETFNHMSRELGELYGEMERKVDAKTAELQQSNASLQLLFNCARMLYSQPSDPSRLMGQLLGKVQQVLGSRQVSLCLNQPTEQTSHTALNSHQGQPDYCRLPHCDECPIKQGEPLPSGLPLASFDLRAGGAALGVLHVELPDGQPLQDWQSQLLVTLADLFAASLSLAQLGQQEARLALMEERAVIARELHDSLAQSLSAQKLQLARLKRQASRSGVPEELSETLAQIEQGLNAAYRKLRELLTTFRIRVDAPGLKPAVEATCKEFMENSGLRIQLDYQLEHCPLTPNEEIHCLQIVREALSNVLKHAQAAHCWLVLHQAEDGNIEVLIDDDGIGIRHSESPSGHYGLSILKERASSLGGQLEIVPRTAGGTRVQLHFTPSFRKIPLHQETA